MFGNEYQIVREFPEYFLDYRAYDHASDNDWIDRIYSTTGTWSGNILDFFYRVTERLFQRIKVPFKLEMHGYVMTRIDETPVHIAIREALVNCVLNADFMIPSGIVILDKPDAIVLSNPGDIRGGKYEMLSGGVSDVRNKAIMKMFNLIGISERAGSGVPRIFDITIPIGDKKPESAIKTGDKLSKESARKNEILIYIAENGKASTAEISKAVGLGLSRTRELVNKLASEGKLKAVGENKNRRYILGGE